MTKRKIITIQDSCFGCMYLTCKINGLVQYHCQKINKTSKAYSMYAETEIISWELSKWFENLCPLEEIK
jgi:hypothetical protein